MKWFLCVCAAEITLFALARLSSSLSASPTILLFIVVLFVDASNRSTSDVQYREEQAGIVLRGPVCGIIGFLSMSNKARTRVHHTRIAQLNSLISCVAFNVCPMNTNKNDEPRTKQKFIHRMDSALILRCNEIWREWLLRWKQTRSGTK